MTHPITAKLREIETYLNHAKAIDDIATSALDAMKNEVEAFRVKLDRIKRLDAEHEK